MDQGFFYYYVDMGHYLGNLEQKLHVFFVNGIGFFSYSF